MKTNVLACSAVAGLALCAGLLVAGPLSPPGGPVASTYKTLTEIEPRTAINGMNTPGGASAAVYVISQPGSYYLPGNISAASGKSAILITANNVALDLNGFTISGVVGATQALVQVTGDASNASDPRGNVVIKNGTIRGGGGDGINASTNAASRVRVENVIAANNAGDGFDLSFWSTFKDCMAFSNGGIGFRSVDNMVASGCVARGNGQDEWSVGNNASITNCIADNASGSGYGFKLGAGNTLTNCSASGSTLDAGFRANAAGNTFNACAATGNGGSGFSSDTGSNAAIGCSAVGNGAQGFSLGISSTITNCTASNNGQHGILAFTGSTISNNACSNNSIDGIRVSGPANATNNNCVNNAGAGILATGASGARIEGNTVVANGTGISVSGGAFVARNIARNNGVGGANDFVSSGTNAIGQIFDVTAGATLTTGNSFANFKY